MSIYGISLNCLYKYLYLDSPYTFVFNPEELSPENSALLAQESFDQQNTLLQRDLPI